MLMPLFHYHIQLASASSLAAVIEQSRWRNRGQRRHLAICSVIRQGRQGNDNVCGVMALPAAFRWCAWERKTGKTRRSEEMTRGHTKEG